MANFDWTDLLHTIQMWDLLRYRAIPHTGFDEFWLDRPVTYHPDLRFIEVQSYSTHWIWRILTGQTCYISSRCEIYWGTEQFHTLDLTNFDWTDLLHIPRSEIYWGTELFHTLDMTNFDWTDLLHTTQIWDLLRYRAIPHTGYDEFWLDRPVTYHPDLRFIEVQSYSTHWIWRILTGQTCYISSRCEIYWGTEQFHTLDLTNFDWTDLLHIPRSEIYWGTELFHTLDMTNFDWTDLLHTTQIWDLLRYRAIPHTGYDEFWLDRPVTYHPDLRFIEVQSYSTHWIWRILTGQTCYIYPDVRFIEVQSYSTHWIWRILTGQTCYIPPRSEIYWGTELFHTFKYWIWRILTGQTCYISSRCEIYWGTEQFHTLDLTNFDWTDLLHTTQIWDLLRYRAIPHTGYDEFWLDRPVTTQMWDLLRYRAIPHTGYDEFWLDRPVTYHPDLRFIEVQSYSTHWIWRILTGQTCYIYPDLRFIEVQSYSTHWIWILTGQTCYIPPRSEIYWGTELFHTLDMTNFDWTDLWHTTQIWDLLRYRAIPHTGYGEFWLDRPVTYHPDVRFIEVQSNSTHWIWRILTGQTCYIYPDLRFIEVQSYSTHWIWRILTGQTCYIPPRSEIYWGTELFHTLDMTNFDWTDLLHTTQIWDLLRYRAIPHTGYGEFWLDRPVTYHPDVRFIEVQSNSTHWIWRILTGQTCYIPPRSEIYWGTELFHTLDMTNFDWTDLLHTTQIWDLLRYRAIPHTGYDEFWLDRPVTYHPDVRFT